MPKTISVAITGANGQLGQSLRSIQSQFPKLKLLFFDRSELDITNPESVTSVFNHYTFDYIVNCAAYTNVAAAEHDKKAAMLLNGSAVGHLAAAANDQNVFMVHISTDYVFDGTKLDPYLPSDKTNPINVYGKSKLLGEQLLSKQCEQYAIIRTSWVYSEFGSNFFTKVKSKADLGESLSITNEYRGCPTYAPDLAKYILDGINNENLPVGISHFTGGQVMSWYDLAKKLLPNADIKMAPNEEEPQALKRPKNSALANL
jgi:dTDP-4-dehydrorhamnose reductase